MWCEERLTLIILVGSFYWQGRLAQLAMRRNILVRGE